MSRIPVVSAEGGIFLDNGPQVIQGGLGFLGELGTDCFLIGLVGSDNSWVDAFIERDGRLPGKILQNGRPIFGGSLAYLGYLGVPIFAGAMD